ncbi:MAG: carboxylating nicotinate-nucleotide diphosphorylase [Bdellovibrionota bacterium]
MNNNTKLAINPVCPYVMPTNKTETQEFTEFCNFNLGMAPSKILTDIERWLEEDHGCGDPTIFSAFQKNKVMQFFIVAKQDFTLSCKPIMEQVFRQVSTNEIELFSNFKDGDDIKKGDIILGGKGKAASILLAERVALNLCSKMSGITTKTKQILSEIKKINKNINLLETRKTTPGLRIYEKYSVRVAGARNHRHALDGGSMLKENHLRCIGFIEDAVTNLQRNLPILTKIEVEVTNLDEFRTALNLGADVIMLDNFSIENVKIAVAEKNKINTQVKLELSGNLDEKNLHEIVTSGVDYMSMGALIHKSIWVDMSLQIYS